jgi:ubiquinone biosynthesis protein UbiJ
MIDHESHPLVQQSQVTAQPFHSHAPVVGDLIARFRTLWSKIAVAPYTQALLAQQNRFNQAVASELVTEDERLVAVDREYVTAAKRVAELAIAAKALRYRIDALEAQLESD